MWCTMRRITSGKRFLDNLQREDLIPIDEAAGYVRLFNDSLAESKSAKIADVAGTVKKSISHVESYLFLDELPDEVKRLMDPRRKESVRLNVTSAIEIARSIPKAATQLRIELAQETIERSLGVVEAREYINQKAAARGFGIAASTRRARDDHRTVVRFIDRTLIDATQINKYVVFEDLYDHIIDDEPARKRDGQKISTTVQLLQNMITELEAIKVKIATPSF
jgi:phage terminase small subunit